VTSRRANGEGSIFPYNNGFAPCMDHDSVREALAQIHLRTNSRDSPHPVGGAHAESRARAGRDQGCRQLGSSFIDGSTTRLLRILPRLRTPLMRAT
jgi:hypothetical protein